MGQHSSALYLFVKPVNTRRPIQVTLSGDNLIIDCCFRYNRAALKPGPVDGLSMADLIEDGIMRLWSGSYIIPAARQTELQTALSALAAAPSVLDRLQVQVRIEPAAGHGMVKSADAVSVPFWHRRRAVPILMRSLHFMPAHVISPLYRRFWGIFKYGQVESMGTNWSPSQPGHMVLPSIRDVWQLNHLAAHEAGHLFGLGDAYAAFYRFYDAAPGTGRYMMHGNRQVQPEEIIMLVKAWSSKRMQYFPRKWNWSRFKNGFKQDIVQRMNNLSREKNQ